MRIHRNLRLRGSTKAVAALLDDIEPALPEGWARDREREDELKPQTGRDSYCFVCDERGDREEGNLHLFPTDEGVFEVTNIVPSEAKRHLSIDEYNRILEDFHSALTDELAGRHGVEVELSPADVDLTHWLSRQTADKLDRFSRLANKSTGSAHFCDEERWYAFLVAAHRERATLASSYLRRWLQEEAGWAEELALGLSHEYESARSLLAYYDRNA